MLIGSFSWDIGSKNTETNTIYSYISILSLKYNFELYIYIGYKGYNLNNLLYSIVYIYINIVWTCAFFHSRYIIYVPV